MNENDTWELITDKMRQVYINLDILLFDHVDSLAGKDRPQEEFISIFDSLHQRGKQILVAAKTAPGQVKTLRPHFRSRLEWGLLSEIQAPDLRSKMTFIRKKISYQSIQVPDDVCFFLANNANDSDNELYNRQPIWKSRLLSVEYCSKPSAVGPMISKPCLNVERTERYVKIKFFKINCLFDF